MALPPTTGAPLNLYVPAFDYGTNPGDDTWDVPANLNWVALNNFASTVVLSAPTTSQTITQPVSTYLNTNAPMVFGTLPTLRFGVLANIWDASLSRTAAGTLSVDDNTPGDGLGTIIAAIFNAGTGFRIGGAAPNGHILLGNGTNYVDSATIPTSAANYQIVEQAGTPITQRNKLNFLAPLTATDNAGSGTSDVGVANSGVTAGTYANPTVTFDAKGRATGATAGAGVTAIVSNVSGSRAFGTSYQNTGLNPIYVSGYGNSNTGSSTAQLVAMIGPSSPTLQVWANEFGATVAGGPCGFSFIVPAGYFYSITATGDVGFGGGSKWFETALS